MTGTSGRLSGTLGTHNSMRYRSYYFDTETGYYYLQSRYYDARWGRFINADEPALVPRLKEVSHSMNLFVYAQNSPITLYDPTGYLAASVYVGGKTAFVIMKMLSTIAAIIAPIGWVIAIVIVAIALGVAVWRISKMSKGGKQNKRDSGLSGYSDKELDRMYKSPSTPKKLKQKIGTEQKARRNRNKQKRKK